MAVVLPAVTPWVPVAVAAAAGLLLVATAGPDPASTVLRLRVSGVAMAAMAAGLLDDPAAVTLAASPAPLVARRSIRFAFVGVVVVLWWALAAAMAGGAIGAAGPALQRELAMLAAVAATAAVAAQRWSHDGRGAAAGALMAVGWFALSFLPRVGAVPLPPQPLDPSSAGPLATTTVAALGLALLLSRDPAATLRPRRSRVR